MTPSEPTSPESRDGIARSVDSLFEALPGGAEGPAAEDAGPGGSDGAAGAAVAAEEADGAGRSDTEARAAEALELLREGEGPALERARALLDPGVASVLAAHLPTLREEEERARIVRALAGLGAPMARALGDELSDARDRFARRVYIEALVEMGADGREVALDMLGDGRWFVVRNGLSILGESGDDELVRHLPETLAHEDARVRTEAVRTLAKMGGEDAGDLAAGMLEDPDADVRAAAALAVGVLRVERAGRSLLERIEEEEDRSALVSQIRALGRLGDPGAVQALEKKASGGLFSRQPSEVRAAAYRALGDIGTPHARRLIEEGAKERDPEVRRAVEAAMEGLRPEGGGAPEDAAGS